MGKNLRAGKILAILACFLCLMTVVFAAGAENEPRTGAPVREHITVKTTSDEDLMAGYIREKMYPSANAFSPDRLRLLGTKLNAGATLTGANKALYDKLMAVIQKVAAGKRTSTAFIFSASDIYPKIRFTAEDLGIDAVSVDGEITDEAVDIMDLIRRDIDVSRVIQCLMADGPYELYWFDKSEDTGGAYTTYPAIDADETTAFLDGPVIIEMIVSRDYATDPDEECFDVDPVYGQRVEKAAANAKAIVEKYESYSDYDRLLAYKKEICARTSYNHQAESGSVAYGNPWQLIWVFDDDESTNVVCEGYAKAFQYLNDLSATKTVSVISVTGWFNGESHMWNVVNMDNGKNYLADITSCDDAMVGYPDKLFLVGYYSGSLEKGYYVKAGGETQKYLYSGWIHQDEDLTLWNKSYKQSEALKPEIPTYSLSNSEGVAGYRVVILLDEEQECIHIKETGETVYPEGDGTWVISSRATEDQPLKFTLAAEREGFVSGWGKTLTLGVKEEKPTGKGIVLPSGTKAIRAETFRWTTFSSVEIPKTVTSIGAYAFADNPILTFVKMYGTGADETAFDNCPAALFLIRPENVETFAKSGKQFLVEIEEE